MTVLYQRSEKEDYEETRKTSPNCVPVRRYEARELGKFTFVPVTEDDAELLVDLRGGGHSKGSKTEVTVEGTKEWIRKVNNDPNFILRLAEGGIGHVRTHWTNGAYEFSWYLNPLDRGRGLSKKMVHAFLDAFPHLREANCRAVIFPGHIPSEKIAESIGMSVVGVDQDGYNIWETSHRFVDAP